ncbi:endonuclease domain-containing 1 protein-like protein [Lates japonicus]|uniref:Endonuclease domain-containing 1 protein-like protein n=1 Tax=Lates japonicus TaxID=270547 RepID=A0AAD3N9B0_LATJO|nr:endonuclease domain-containing 1 protein-like protein [Lates japonicus]
MANVQQRVASDMANVQQRVVSDMVNVQPICQFYNKQFHFATLYNRDHRAPLYSAYILKTAHQPDQRPPNPTWYYETQLANSNGEQSMKPFPVNDQNVRESQAMDEDYATASLHTRGHLNAAGHQKTVDDVEATFTLTNIVPQRLGSNNGPWNVLENEVLGRLAHCTGEMYVITGAIPYKTESEFKKHWLKDKDGKDRVAIPEYMWSAYCCPNHTPNTQFFPTYAAVGRNDPDSNNDTGQRIQCAGE